MQEFPQSCATATAGHARYLSFGGLMVAADQCGQQVAIGRVAVVTRAIQLGWHQADCIKAVLAAHHLAQVNTCDLCDRIPLILELQRTREQRFLPDRLLGELRVDAAAAQKQPPPYDAAPSRFDHMRLELEVLKQEVRRVAAVGLDAAHLRRCQQHHRKGVRQTISPPPGNRSDLAQIWLP
jgi:hypothetical protein